LTYNARRKDLGNYVNNISDKTEVGLAYFFSFNEDIIHMYNVK